MTATLTNRRSAAGRPRPRRPHAAPRRRRRGSSPCSFVLPALLLLGALVVYPVLFSVGRSFFDASGDRFVGGDNYTEMFTRPGHAQGRPQHAPSGSSSRRPCSPASA